MPIPFFIPNSVPKENHYAALSSEGDNNDDVRVVIYNTSTTSIDSNSLQKNN